MSKKCWFMIALCFTLAAVSAIAIPALWPPTPGVTYANFSRLEKGMTRESVEGLLGKPNATRQQLDDKDVMPELHHPFRVLNATGWTNWQNNAEDFVSVHFDEKDCLTVSTWNVWADDRTAWEKLRDRFPFIAKTPPTILFTVD